MQLNSIAYEWKILFEWGTFCFCSLTILLKSFKFFDPDTGWQTQARVSSRPRRMGLACLLSPALESAIHARPKMRGSRNHVRPKTFEYDKHVWFDKQQTKRTIVHSSCHERENKEKTQIIYHRRQSNHYLSTRAIQYGRWHNCASSETWDDQIWPPGSVTHAFLMAQAPSIRCGKKRKPKKIS